MAKPTIVRVITYSQPSPGRKMKKPLPRWLVTMATSITPITAAPANGVRRPTTSSAPPTTSVMLATHACRMPGFMPRLANQRAVPAILPPPKMWLMPWASITAPTPHRRASRARLIESTSALSIAGQRTGIDRREGPSVASAAMPKPSTIAKVLGVVAAATAGALAVQEAKKRLRRGGSSGASRSRRRAATLAPRRWRGWAPRPAASTRSTGPARCSHRRSGMRSSTRPSSSRRPRASRRRSGT